MPFKVIGEGSQVSESIVLKFDEVEKLDIPHMTQIIRRLLDVTQEFAERDEAPAWNKQGEEVLKRLQRPRKKR